MKVVQYRPRFQDEPRAIVVEETVTRHTYGKEKKSSYEHRFSETEEGGVWEHVESMKRVASSWVDWVDSDGGNLSSAIEKLLREVDTVEAVVDDDGNTLGSISVHVPE